MSHFKKIFRTLAVAIILSLLLVAIPATPVQAAYLTMSPTSGPAGTLVTVNGSGFSLNHNIEIDFNWVAKAWPNSAWGTFTTSFTVPTIGAGRYEVTAIDLSLSPPLVVATALFTVTAVIPAEIELDPDEGPVDTEVEISGEDFGDREDITVEYDGDEVDIESGDDDTDSGGDFECTIIIPKSAAGDHTITVIGDDSDIEAEAEFTVEPAMTISPTSGTPGTMVIVTATGFDGRSDITIYFNDVSIATDESDKYGSFEAAFDVPTIESGTYDIEAEDEDGNTEKARFKIKITLTADLKPTTGNIGTLLTATGSGFRTGTTVTITYDDVKVATTAVGAGGAFSVTFNAPAGNHGEHTITVTDGTTTKQFTFTMESDAPPIPAPLLPQMGVKAEQPVYFDWEDVTDDSPPVLYTLLIASDDEFTSDSIVLEKEKLEKSEYTITEAEKLLPAKKEAPYYWRVRAVDGASNESGWSTPGSFDIGFVFVIPDWAKYALMGLGGLLLWVLGFWLGKMSIRVY